MPDDTARDAADLPESDERFRQLLENIDQAVILRDFETWQVLYANTACRRLFDSPAPEGMSDPVPAEDLAAIRAVVARTGGSPRWDLLYRAARNDGVERWIRSRGFPVREPGGKVRRFGELAEDATDRVQLALALEQSEAGLRHAQALAGLAHVVTAPDGSFVEWSRSLPRLIARDESHMPRSTREWLDLLDPADRDAFRNEAIAAARGGSRAAFRYRLKRGDGAWIHLSQVAEPLAGSEQTAGMRWFSTIQDITGIAQAEEEVRRLNAELEDRVAHRTHALQETNREIEALTHSVAHELRAPLRAIEGFSALIQERHGEELSPAALEHFERVRGNTARMAQLIDDLLSFVRIARQPLARARVPLDRVVKKCLDRFQAEIGSRNVIVRVAALPECDCDEGLIGRVFGNLLDNALKFSRPIDKALIVVGTEREGEVFVRDNGIGFDMTQAARIFGVFERLHGDPRFEGTGMGLAIAQRIVERHGGQMRVEAAPGKGATAYFSLP